MDCQNCGQPVVTSTHNARITTSVLTDGKDVPGGFVTKQTNELCEACGTKMTEGLARVILALRFREQFLVLWNGGMASELGYPEHPALTLFIADQFFSDLSSIVGNNPSREAAYPEFIYNCMVGFREVLIIEARRRGRKMHEWPEVLLEMAGLKETRTP